MKQVTIKREDYFRAVALLGPMLTTAAGSIWCNVVITDEQITVLKAGGINVAT